MSCLKIIFTSGQTLDSTTPNTVPLSSDIFRQDEAHDGKRNFYINIYKQIMYSLGALSFIIYIYEIMNTFSKEIAAGSMHAKGILEFQGDN